MKVLITGATGFIGSHLAENLRESGHEVLCISRDALNIDVLKAAGCKVILGDLNNCIDWDALLGGIEVVYHVAGITRCRDAREYYEGNYCATKRFVDVCASRCANLKRFLYVSSLSAIGPSLNGLPVNESTPYRPVSHYGKSKMLAELEVLRAANRLPVTIVRPSLVYGPRERDMLDYIRMIKHGVELLIGLREKLFSLIYCDDLVQGIRLAVESARGIGKAYFVGSEEICTGSDLGATIARVVAAHPLKIRLPHALVYCVGAAAVAVAKITRRQMFFTLEKAKESTQPAWTCSVDNAIADFGFHQNIGLEEGMRRSYAWYLENKWL